MDDRGGWTLYISSSCLLGFGVEVPYVIGYVISLYNVVFLVTTAP